MTFASKDLCEKLEKMGCKGISGFWYFPKRKEPVLMFEPDADDPHFYAFTLEDFVGTHEQAKENARIVWENVLLPTEKDNNVLNQFSQLRWRIHRYLIIDSEDWVKYLEKTIK